MSFNKSLTNLPKITKLVIIGIVLAGFGTWQLFFLKTALNIDIPMKVSNIFSNSILPDGFCKDCNVILISLDTLRAKSLPCYGYEKDTAPNLCNFAKESFLFTNTYSPSPKTLDSHFSIFTSLYPLSHKMTVPFSSNLSTKILTITQVLKSNGYDTLYAGPPTDPNLPLKRGLGRDFDTIIGAGDPDAWIKSINSSIAQNKKFFAFLHTYWVHEPYIPIRENITKYYSGNVDNYISWDQLCEKTYKKLLILHPERFISSMGYNKKQINYCEKIKSYGNAYAYSMSNDEHEQFYTTQIDSYWNVFDSIVLNKKKVYMQALYETRIYELDLEMKKFFNFLENKNLLSNTIVIITSDHGEEFYEHGNRSHGFNLYNEVTKVPLIIYVPKSKGQMIDKLASSIDITPSILHLLNIKVPLQFLGINLFSKNDNDYIISQNYNIQKQSIISKDWKLLINIDNKDNKKTRELYSQKSDPGEQNNLEEINNTIADQLEQRLNTILSKQPVYEPEKIDTLPTWIDEKQRKKLIETGYF